jgi:uncharacterized protein
LIGQRELERRAESLGISVQHVELDYVLNHVLAAIALDPGPLVFRGGTALGRVYWPDFRISEDLDFICEGNGAGLDRLVRGAVAGAAETTGIGLDVSHDRWRDDRARSLVRWATPWGAGGELVIDVVRHERARIPVEARALALPYSDLKHAERIMPVLDLSEILANKWLMLDDRHEPRDLFDLWWAISQEGVDFAEIATAHRVTYGHAPMPSTLERAARLEPAWVQRLAHQRRHLPPFDDVLGAVRKAFESWRSDEGR